MESVSRTTALTTDVGCPAPSPPSPTGNDVDAHAFNERTRKVKVDVNDYSRFKDIGADSDSDSDEAKAKNQVAAKKAAAANALKCRNCSKSGAKLKCSVCRKAVYCARKCQASDWQFHKRICRDPELEKKASQPPEPPRTPSLRSSTSTAAPPIKTTTAASSSSGSQSKHTSSGSAVVVTEEPDLPKEVRGYKNGLPYFHRELSEKEKSLIGDIAPQKIEAKPLVVSSTQHGGSAWNSAGTFEERVVTKWAENKWHEIFTGVTYVEGSMQATLKAPEKVTGDASICVVRGKKRYLFDFNFKLPFEVSISGSDTCMGSYEMNDISNDEDYEITCTLTKTPSQASEQSAVQAFVAKKNSGLQKKLSRLIGVFVNDFQQQ